MAADDQGACMARLQAAVPAHPLLTLDRHRAVRCTAAVPAHTPLLSIPRRLLITADAGRVGPIGAKVAAAAPPLSNADHCFLALHLLCDAADAASPHHPYYAALPAALPHSPLFWDTHRLQWLRGSHTLQALQRRKARIGADYAAILAAAPELRGTASLHDFTWARAIVASRAFSLTLGSRKTHALVPLADMLDHRSVPNATWTGTPTGLVVAAAVPLAPGQEVHISYGNKCNSAFFLDYGFAVPRNAAHNRLLLHLPAPAPRLALWVGTSYAHPATQEAFSRMRTALATPAQLARRPAAGHCPPLSPENEIGALRALASRFALQAAVYPSSLEADSRELDMGGPLPAPSPVRRATLLLLQGEKAVASFFVALPGVVVPLLQSTWTREGAAIQARFAGPDSVAVYVRACVVPLLHQKAAEAAETKAIEAAAAQSK